MRRVLIAALATAGLAAGSVMAATPTGATPTVTICHQGQTIEVPHSLVWQHFDESGPPQPGHEGDTRGPCPTTTTTTAPPLVCTGNPDTDESGCPIDDCALPPGNRPTECDEPELIPPVVIIVPAPPAVPVPDEPSLAG